MFTRIFVLVCLAVSAATAQSYCDNYPQIEPCAKVANRDIMFAVDASNSMNPNRFYNDVLDYTLQLFCAFKEGRSKAGMLTFASQIEVKIPLAQHTRDEWYNQVIAVRDTKDTENPACCSCCTPTADAFRVGYEEFERRARSDIQMLFMITDGVPSNNRVGDGGLPQWAWQGPATGQYDPAVYSVVDVPAMAQQLKDSGRRVILVGVPNNDGDAPDKKYFDGGYANGFSYCQVRQGDNYCADYFTDPPVFPIVSEPVSENSFTTKSWNNDDLILELVDTICAIPATNTPTKLPTMEPTKMPTQLPTASPQGAVLDQVDLTFLVDRSDSMNYVPKLCTTIVQTFPNEEIPEGVSPCWLVWTKFIQNLVRDMLEIDAGEKGSRKLGWRDEHAAVEHFPERGLRVNIIGFACYNNQRSPLMFEYSRDLIGGPIKNENDFIRVMDWMKTNVTPFGGTCPHLAVEQAVKYIEQTEEVKFPLQAVVLMTDGVFYDGQATPRATKGLDAYKALKYAVGVSISQGKNRYGMTQEEIETQRRQLTKFVDGNAEYFYNIKEGFDGILDVTKSIADSLPAYFFNSQGAVTPRYRWCGFRRKHNCQTMDWRQGNCKWVGRKGDQYKCRKRKL